VGVVAVDGAELWVRVTRDVDNGASGNDTKFYTSADGLIWTQLGATVTNAGVTTINANVASVSITTIGSLRASGGFAYPVNGTIFRAQVLDGIDGTIIFDADFTAVSDLATSFTESSPNAATVTINSTTGVDTNDPLLLMHTGTNYLYLPGIAGNYASLPDLAAQRPTGDLELVIRVSAVDWTPSTTQRLLCSGANSIATLNYALSIQSSGALTFERYVSGGGAGTRFANSTVATGFADRSIGWIKATFDADNGSGGSDFNFYTAADQSSEPSSWTQLGTTVTVAGVTGAGNSNTSGIKIGTNPIDSTERLVGSVYRTIVRDGIGGTTQLDANFTTNTNQSSFTELSSNAATVTINRSTSGRKSVMVTRPVWLFGTDDYLEIADNALLDFGATDSFSVAVVARTWSAIQAPNAYPRFVEKCDASGALNGYSLVLNNLTLQPRASVEEAGSADIAVQNGSVFSSGAQQLISMIVDRSAETLAIGQGSTLSATVSTSTVGTVANTAPFKIGRGFTSADGQYEGEIVAVAVFRSALTSTQLGQIANYYGV